MYKVLVVGLLVCFLQLNYATAGKPVGYCEDGNDKCPEWEKHGDCDRFPENMNVLCRKSCNRCHLPFPCEDNHKDCKKWEQAGECTNNPSYMRWFCKVSCDTCEEHQKRPTVERTPAESDAAGVDQFMAANNWGWMWAAIGFGGILGLVVLIILIVVRKYHCISTRKTLP